MKKLMVMATLVAASLFAQAATLAEARAQIGACIADSAKMTATVKSLSAADQVAFLAEVNAAIEKMPGSNESKSAAYLNANEAALRGAAKDNLAAMVAEVYATVPPESLTVVNERLASDVFNRSADPSVTYTDEQFTKISETLVEKVAARTADQENGAARTTFAVLMMMNASNGTPADLADKLTAKLPADAQNTARNEWIPAAMGQNQSKTYEPLLGAADAQGQAPIFDVVIRLAGPQTLDALLADAIQGAPLVSAMNNPDNNAQPALDNENIVAPTLEPIGYQGQML